MLSSTTCVGLRYGRHIPEASMAFPGSGYSTLSPQAEAFGVLSPVFTGFNVEIRLDAMLSPLRPHIAVYTGVGILTHFPSASPFDLSLGPG